MAYHKTQYAKLNEGRGTIKDGSYVPFIKPHEFGSKGLESRLICRLTNNLVVCLSKLELLVYYLLLWDENVSGIYAQYPLPLPETIEIADQLGIRHPKMKENGMMIPIVRTIDFLVKCVDDTFMAYTVKPSKELTKRTLKKYLIEKVYLSKKNIPYKIVTEKAIDLTMAVNIYTIQNQYNWDKDNHVDEKMLTEMITAYCYLLTDSNHDCIKTVQKWANMFDMTHEDGINFTKYLLIHKKITADMSEPLIFKRAKLHVSGEKDDL